MELHSFYAGTVPAAAADSLKKAARAYADTPRAEALLWEAHREAPEALPVYFSLYKFYFYKGRLADAERTARLGLDVASRQGGFPTDWEQLTPECTDWTAPDSPQHFYLFSLKALAFIRLRLGDVRCSQRILRKLAELDAQDTVGGSVISALAARVSARHSHPTTEGELHADRR